MLQIMFMECNQEYRGRKDETHAWEILALKVLHVHIDESTMDI